MNIRNLLGLIMMGILFVACGPQSQVSQSGQDSQNPATNSAKVLTVDGNFSNHVWSELTYTVSGGGDLSFTVIPVSGSAEFRIHVSRSNFQPCSFTFSLKPSDSPTLYNSVANLMDGTSIVKTVSNGGTSYGGTWTSISFYHPAVGPSQTYSGFLVVGDPTVISALSGFVRARL